MHKYIHTYIWQCLLATNGIVLGLLATALLGLGAYCLTNAQQAQNLGDVCMYMYALYMYACICMHVYLGLGAYCLTNAQQAQNLGDVCMYMYACICMHV